MAASGESTGRKSSFWQTTAIAAGVAMVVGLFWQYRLWSEMEDLRARDEQAPPEVIQRIQRVEGLIAQGEDAVPALIERLETTDSNARRDATLALARIGPPAAAALPALAPLVDDPDPVIRENSLLALGRIADDIEPYVPLAIRHLADPEHRVCEVAMALLTEIGPSCASQIARAFPGFAFDAQHRAFLVLAALGYFDSEVLSSLRSSTRDECPPDVREMARLMILGSGAATDEEIREGLLAGDQHESLALRAIELRGEAGAPLALDLAGLLDRKMAEGRYLRAPLKTIASLGEAARDALPALRRVIGNSSVQSYERAQATVVAWRLGVPGEELMTALDAMLALRLAAHGKVLAAMAEIDPRAARERFIAWCAGHRGEADDWRVLFARAIEGEDERFFSAVGAPALPYLMELLEAPGTPQYSARQAALRGLGGLGPAAGPAVPRLLELLESGYSVRKPLTHIQILTTLGRIGSGAAEAIPHLQQLFGNGHLPENWDGSGDSKSLTFDVIDCLAALGAPEDYLLDTLKTNLRAPSFRLAVPAARRLLARWTDVAECIDVLRRALLDSSGETWEPAAFALGTIGPRAAPALPEMTDVLRRSSGPGHVILLDALMQIAWPADSQHEAVAALVEALVPCLDDPQADIRRGAARVLGEFGPAARPALPALERARNHWRNRGGRRIELAGPRSYGNRATRKFPFVDRFFSPEWLPSRTAVRDEALRAIQRIEAGAPPGETTAAVSP